MKYSKQSPTIVEDMDEYNSIFQNINSTLISKGYVYSKDIQREASRNFISYTRVYQNFLILWPSDLSYKSIGLWI